MNKELPLVSVITGYYNRKQGLKECIESILGQTYKNIEFIVFDDRSTDGTYEMLMEFTDPRLKVIQHEKNMGFTKGMINAVSKATGEYVTVHGAGDISLPTRIEKQIKVLSTQEDVAIVGCFYNNYNIVSGAEEKVRMKEYYTREDVFEKTPISQGGAMFRRAQYLSVGGYNPAFKFVQDGELWLRLTELGKIYVVQQVLYTRIVFADGVSFNTKKTIQQSKYSLLARHIHRLPVNERQWVIDKCVAEGIDAVIPFSNRSIQKKLFKKFHTVLDVQDTENLQAFIQYSSGLYKAYYRLMIYAHRFKPVKGTLNFFRFRVYKPLKHSLKA